MWFVWVTGMAPVVQGLDLPDVVGIARNVAQRINSLWHSAKTQQTSQPAWPMLRQPQLLPKAQEVKAMSGPERYERVAYYWEVFVLIFVTILLLGTIIMACGPRVKACFRTKSSYLPLEVDEVGESTRAIGKGQILGISSQKRLLAAAFGATLLACTVACAYSVQTERLSCTTGLDFELYAILLTGGTVAWSNCCSMFFFMFLMFFHISKYCSNRSLQAK